MKEGDVVIVQTGCCDCGEIPAKIIKIIEDDFYIELIGDLPKSVKSRYCIVKLKYIKEKNDH